MDGFIRLNRKFFTSSYWNQKRTFSFAEAWLDLIFLARFDAEPKHEILPGGREITINRGEIRASLRFLSERWGWGVEKTQRFINRNIEKQDISRRTEQGESLLLLCNYGKYNPLPNTGTDTRPYTDPHSNRTSTRTNNKKVEKQKKEEKENNRHSLFEVEKKTFGIFRQRFGGRKDGLDTEFQRLQKHADWKEALDELLPALEKERLWRENREQTGAFTPPWANLSTWINNRRWEQELPSVNAPEHSSSERCAPSIVYTD